jgi:hypothetical protein
MVEELESCSDVIVTAWHLVVHQRSRGPCQSRNRTRALRERLKLQQSHITAHKSTPVNHLLDCPPRAWVQKFRRLHRNERGLCTQDYPRRGWTGTFANIL